MEGVKSRLARGYSRTAPLYDGLAGPMYLSGLRRLLPRLRIPPMAAILDVGCGTGLNLLEAARYFAPTRLLAGIDIAPGMVETAQAKAAAQGIAAEFIVGDAEQLPYPDRTFDLVICNSVFHWFRDRHTAMQEMARVLRPGGQLALICAAAGGFREWVALMETVTGLISGPTASSNLPPFPTAQEVGTLMQGSGLLVTHLANPTNVQRVFQPEQFVGLMSVVSPAQTADLTPQGQQLADLLATQILRSHFRSGFPLTWSAIEAVGTRIA